MGGATVFLGLLITIVAILRGKYLPLVVGIPSIVLGFYAMYVVVSQYMDYLLWIKTYGEVLK